MILSDLQCLPKITEGHNSKTYLTLTACVCMCVCACNVILWQTFGELQIPGWRAVSFRLGQLNSLLGSSIASFTLTHIKRYSVFQFTAVVVVN